MTWVDKIRLYLIYTIAVTLIILAVAFSVLRAVLPYATGYVENLEQELAQQIGLPVSIASMDADMYWLVPRLKLVDVVIYDKDKQRELLRLDEAFFALAYIDSILQRTPTVGDISLIGADLYIERYADNRWRIQGVEFGGDNTSSNSNSSSEIIAAIKNTSFSLLDSDIHWKDYGLRGGQLDFIGANIFIEEFLDDHSLEMNLQLPKAYGDSFRLIVKTDGDIAHLLDADLDVYLQGSSINMGQWLFLVDDKNLPKINGIFDGELWLARQNKVLSKITLDGSLKQLDVTKKSHGGFSLDKVEGRFEWGKTDQGWYFNSHDVSLIRQDVAWKKSASIAVIQDQGGLFATATYLRSQDLIEAANVFLDDKQLGLVKQYRPNHFAGDFYNLALSFSSDATSDIKFSATVENLDFYVPDSDILFRGVDGSLAYSNDQAKIELLSETVTIDFGDLFRQPLSIDLIEGVVLVERKASDWVITSEDFYFLNSDIEVNMRLKLVADTQGAVFADIQSNFINAFGASVHKYYPVSIMSIDVIDWLDMAITDGYVESGSFILHGDLSRFPYEANDGVMEVVFDMRYLTLNFLQGWPGVNDTSGHFRFHNSAMSISAISGQTFQSEITRAKALIPNLSEPRLFVDGRVLAPAANLQQYVWNSGLDDVMGDVMREFQASGETELLMSIEVPLENDDAVLTKGELRLKGNELYLPVMDYELKDVHGSLFFENDQLNAKQVKAVFEGADINIDVLSTDLEIVDKNMVEAEAEAEDGLDQEEMDAETVFYITGRLPADGILKKFTWIPKDWIDGASDWDMVVHFPKIRDEYFMRVEMSSTLEGTAITLSDEISKEASTPLAVDFELKALDGALQVDVNSEENFTFFATRNEGDVWDFVVDSSLVRGRGQSAEDLNKESTSYLDLEYIDLVRVFKTTKKGGDKISLPPTFFPSLSFKVKELDWNDWKFNNVKLETSWHSHGMLINSVDFQGPSLQVNARGSWLTSWKNAHESNFKIFINSSNLGNTLSSLNISDAMKGTEYSATIDWRWFDEPYLFSWETVQGHSSFTMKDGEVKALDPGASGRLVGLFNIFKLFNRLTLDFDDVSGDGFVFESVKGNYEFRDGFALTKNIEVSASTADMKLQGQIGMVNKDYDMLMQVEPHLSAATFTTGALAGGPILGAGLVLINKIFGLEESTFDEYKITGSWDDPQVTKVVERNSNEAAEQ